MKKGFTLAEVLITLGIIGIVAAMTMPSLIANYQKKVWVNQLKKSVSIVEQGIRLMMADEGVDNIYYTTTFAPVKANECRLDGKGSSADEENFSCIDYANGFKKYFNGEIQAVPPDYIWHYYDIISDADDVGLINICRSIMVLNDGMIICPIGNGVSVDVNGYKRPNMFGKDIFSFEFAEDGHVKAFENEPASKCPDKTPNADLACFARIIENGWVMDY